MSRGDTYTLYPITNYGFGTKTAKNDKDHSVSDRLSRLKTNYDKDGMRRSVEGIVLVHEHNHPHVLLLQAGTSFFKLPGGRLRRDENEIDGLKRKLTNNLAPTNASLQVTWDVGDCAGVFWRPNFDTMFYPYIPPHITRPKECKKLFVIPLPDRCVFAVPKNMKLVAVPVFELYDNWPRYGPVICAIPALLSRFKLNVYTPIPRPMPNVKTEAQGSMDQLLQRQHSVEVKQQQS